MEHKPKHPDYKPHEADRLAVEIEKDARLIKKFGYRGSFILLFVAVFIVIGLAVYGLLAASSQNKVALNSQQAGASMLRPRPTITPFQLTVTATPQQVAPGSSYTLRASYKDGYGQILPYTGQLSYQLRFCPQAAPTNCQTSTGPWGTYTLTIDPTDPSKGMVTVNLPTNTAQGVYNASFMPLNGKNWTWSNELPVTVTSSSTPPPVASGNLVTNGDFEQPVLPNNVEGWDTIANGTPGLAWHVNWTNPAQHTAVCTTPRLEFQAGVNNWVSASGMRHAELDADCGTGADKGIVQDALVDISQTLTTQPGATYKVSFYFAPRPGTNNGDNILSVFFGGQRIARLTDDGTADYGTVAWRYYTYYVTPTTSQSEIRFSGRESYGDSLGIFLDNVKVERVQ